MLPKGLESAERERVADEVVIKLPNPCLVVPIGPSGAGKSTFLREHFLPTEIVSSDTCRAYVSDDVRDQTCNKQAFKLFHTWIDARLQLNKRTVADATNLRGFARRKLRKIAASYRFPVVALLFSTGRELCLKRNRMRTRQVPEQVIHRHVEQYEEAVRAVNEEGFHQVITIRPDRRYRIVPADPVGSTLVGW